MEFLQHGWEAFCFEADTKRHSAFLAPVSVSLFLRCEFALNESGHPESMQRYVVASLSRHVAPLGSAKSPDRISEESNSRERPKAVRSKTQCLIEETLLVKGLCAYKEDRSGLSTKPPVCL